MHFFCRVFWSLEFGVPTWNLETLEREIGKFETVVDKFDFTPKKQINDDKSNFLRAKYNRIRTIDMWYIDCRISRVRIL